MGSDRSGSDLTFSIKIARKSDISLEQCSGPLVPPAWRDRLFSTARGHLKQPTGVSACPEIRTLHIRENEYGTLDISPRPFDEDDWWASAEQHFATPEPEQTPIASLDSRATIWQHASDRDLRWRIEEWQRDQRAFCFATARDHEIAQIVYEYELARRQDQTVTLLHYDHPPRDAEANLFVRVDAWKNGSVDFCIIATNNPWTGRLCLDKAEELYPDREITCRNGMMLLNKPGNS